MNKAHARTGQQAYKTLISASGNELISDEPIDKGGQHPGFNPGELLASSLASCTSITVRMYTNRKEWPLEEVAVSVEVERDASSNHTVFRKKVELIGPLTDEQRERLLVIADKCPIHKSFQGTFEFQELTEDDE